MFNVRFLFCFLGNKILKDFLFFTLFFGKGKLRLNNSSFSMTLYNFSIFYFSKF